MQRGRVLWLSNNEGSILKHDRSSNKIKCTDFSPENRVVFVEIYNEVEILDETEAVQIYE